MIKKNEQVWFWAKFSKIARKLRKVLFYETYFKESNIDWNPLILSQDKIRMKFGQKKWMSLILGKVYENWPKIEEKCYLMNLTSKRVM